MESVSEEFGHKFARLAANIVLALAFAATGAISSTVLTSTTGGLGFYSWLALTLVAGVFLVRALFDAVTTGDKTIKLLLRRIGIHQRWFKRRIAKDSMCIIATILTTAALFPFFENRGTLGTNLQSATTVVATGIIFIFVYDIAQTLYRAFHERASALTDWLVHKPDGEMK